MHTSRSIFQKRTYSIAGFLIDLRHILGSLLHRSASRTTSPPLDPAFSERIMLAVTQVNDCRYCNYAHTQAALRAGVTQVELDAIKAGDFSAAPSEELPALLFAQHYAAEAGQPDSDAVSALVETYGDAKAKRILLTIRMITLGNLLGNTFDGVVYSLRGRTIPGWNIFEGIGVLLMVLVSAPLMLVVGFGGILLRVIPRALLRGSNL